MKSSLSIGQCATLACLLEVAAPKPGNVHRGADFEDLAFEDFAASAVAIAPAMEAAVDRRLGATVLSAIEATHHAVARNTNLGTVLLLAPLAKTPRHAPLESGVADVLASCGPDDARDVYAAIRLAAPGGMGKVDQYDVADAPPTDLMAAMRAGAARDMVARQYAEDFHHVLGVIAPWLREAVAGTWDRPKNNFQTSEVSKTSEVFPAKAKSGSYSSADPWQLAQSIVYVQMRFMAEYPDSLIARKCGLAVAQEASDRAARVLAAGKPGNEEYHRALADFDFWLRSDGRRRNPGTTADLIAAALFAGLRDGWIGPLPARLAGEEVL